MLEKRRINPRIPGTEVKGRGSNLYRLKLLKEGLRLIYEVDDINRIVVVIAVGKRDKNAIYDDVTNDF